MRLLRSLVTLASLATAASAAGAQTVSSWNQTFHGPRNTTSSSVLRLVATGSEFTPADLVANGPKTLSTTLKINPQAANWLAQGNLFVFGFVEDIRENPPAILGGDGYYDGNPLVYFQNNTNGVGYCMDTQFYVGPNFAFTQGPNAVCSGDLYHAGMNVGAYATFTMTAHANGQWNGSITFLDAMGAPLVGSVGTQMNGPNAGASVSNGFTFGDAFIGGAKYTPYLRLATGYDTGGQGIANPDAEWSIDVSQSSLTVASTSTPEPASLALVATGLIAVAAGAARRRRPT